MRFIVGHGLSRAVHDSFYLCAEDNRRSGTLIYLQAKNVRPGIVSGGVEVESGTRDICQVEICDQDTFFFEQRPSEHLTKGTDDATAAADEDCRWVVSLRTI